jgi:hypothetical protein
MHLSILTSHCIHNEIDYSNSPLLKPYKQLAKWRQYHLQVLEERKGSLLNPQPGAARPLQVALLSKLALAILALPYFVCKIGATIYGAARFYRRLMHVLKSPQELSQIPQPLRTPHFYLWVVSFNGSLFKYIPQAERTEDICLEAVRRNRSNFGYVPFERRNEQMCQLIFANGGYCSLKEIPEAFRTQERCHLAVTRNPANLAYVPLPLRDEALCRLALEQDPFVFDCVPQQLQTEQLAAFVLSKHDKLLEAALATAKN